MIMMSVWQKLEFVTQLSQQGAIVLFFRKKSFNCDKYVTKLYILKLNKQKIKILLRNVRGNFISKC